MPAKIGALMALLAAAVVPLSPALAQGEGQYRKLDFAIVVNGITFGHHGVEVRFACGEAHAEIAGDLTFRIGPLVITRIQQEAREVLRNGELVEFELINTTGYYDEKVRRYEARRTDNGEIHLVDHSRGREHRLPSSALALTGWNRDVLFAPVIINTKNGRPVEAEVTERGREEIRLPIGVVEAERYDVDGELDAEAWYELGSRDLVQLRFTYRGNRVTYQLRERIVESFETDC